MNNEEEKIVVSYMVDAETGEIYNQLYEGDSQKIIRKESKEFLLQQKLKEEELVEINQGRKFTKFMESAGEKLAKAKLTGSQYAIILGITDYIEYETGLLVTKKGRNAGKLLNGKDIQRICDINSKTFSAVIGELIELKILGSTKVGRETHYLVNPFIFYNGKLKIPKTTYELFKNSIWNPNYGK